MVAVVDLHLLFLSRAVIAVGWMVVAYQFWRHRRRDYRRKFYYWVIGTSLLWSGFLWWIAFHPRGIPTPFMSAFSRVLHYPLIAAFLLMLTYRVDTGGDDDRD